MKLVFLSRPKGSKAFDIDSLSTVLSPLIEESETLNFYVQPQFDSDEFSAKELAEISFSLFQFCDIFVFASTESGKLDQRTYLEIGFAKDCKDPIYCLKEDGSLVILGKDCKIEKVCKSKSTKTNFAKVLVLEEPSEVAVEDVSNFETEAPNGLPLAEKSA